MPHARSRVRIPLHSTSTHFEPVRSAITSSPAQPIVATPGSDYVRSWVKRDDGVWEEVVTVKLRRIGKRGKQTERFSTISHSCCTAPASSLKRSEQQHASACESVKTLTDSK
jgi:hypothetical protein